MIGKAHASPSFPLETLPRRSARPCWLDRTPPGVGGPWQLAGLLTCVIFIMCLCGYAALWCVELYSALLAAVRSASLPRASAYH